MVNVPGLLARQIENVHGGIRPLGDPHVGLAARISGIVHVAALAGQHKVEGGCEVTQLLVSSLALLPDGAKVVTLFEWNWATSSPAERARNPSHPNGGSVQRMSVITPVARMSAMVAKIRKFVVGSVASQLTSAAAPRPAAAPAASAFRASDSQRSRSGL